MDGKQKNKINDVENVMEDLMDLFSGDSSKSKSDGNSFVQELDSLMYGSLEDAKKLKNKDKAIGDSTEDVVSRIYNNLEHDVELIPNNQNRQSFDIMFTGDSADFQQFYRDVKSLDGNEYADEKVKGTIILESPQVKERFYGVNDNMPIVLDKNLNLVVDSASVGNKNIDSLYKLSETYNIHDLYNLGIQLQFANEYLNKNQVDKIEQRYDDLINHFNENLIVTNELILNLRLGKVDDTMYFNKYQKIIDYREETNLTGLESNLSPSELEALGYGYDGYDLITYLKESELKSLEEVVDFYEGEIAVVEVAKNSLLDNIKISNARYLLNNDIGKVIQYELNGKESQDDRRKRRLSTFGEDGDASISSMNADVEYE